jgi:CDP-glucose 4,6-dehydratase
VETVNPVFWRDRKVLITGHTGFKGAWLSIWLQSAGARVAGYSLDPPTSPNLFELANVGQGMESVIGDIRDVERLAGVLKRFQPEIVIHMAAQALVRRGYRHPVATFDVNVVGTACLLEAIRQTDGVKVGILVTSDKCYQAAENSGAFKETDALGGSDPYSSSKACAELVIAAYRSSYFNRSGGQSALLASVRAGNVIGGGDWAEERLVPDVVRAIAAGRAVAIRHPHAIRPWQHVLEPLGGYLLLAEKLFQDGSVFEGAWNFGPPEEDSKPVDAVVQRIVKLWGEGADWLLDGGQHPQETKVLKLDCRKAQQHLGWKPRWQLEQALEATVTWYKGHLQGQNVRDLALQQLDSYQSLAMEAAR